MVRSAEAVRELREAVRTGDRAKASELIGRLHPADAAALVMGLLRKEQKQLFGLLNAEQAADVVETMDTKDQVAVVQGLSSDKASEIVEEMDSDKGADLLGQLPKSRKEELLREIPMLGVVVALALWLNTILSVLVGGTVPLLLKRFGFDPAMASGPILTTLTDMCGFFLILSLASLFLPFLV